MSKTIKLIFDTRDAVLLNGNTNNVQFNMSDQLRDVRKQINWIQFDKCKVPHTFYNIISSNNSAVFDIYTAGDVLIGTINITMPEGHYSSTEFATAMKTLLDADLLNADTYTVANDSITDLQTITNDAGNKIIFRYDLSTMGRVMGYRDLSPSDGLPASASDSIVSTTQPDLRGVTGFMIRSNLHDRKYIRYSGSDDSDTFFAYVPIDSAYSYGSTIVHKNDNPLDIVEVSRLPDVINLALVNRKQVLLDINNYDWEVSIIVNYRE